MLSQGVQLGRRKMVGKNIFFPLLLLAFCHEAMGFLVPSSGRVRTSVLKSTARNDEGMHSPCQFCTSPWIYETNIAKSPHASSICSDGRVTRRSLLQTALGGALMAPFLTFPNTAEAKAVKRLKNAPMVDIGNGVSYQDMAIGDGKPPKPGDIVSVLVPSHVNIRDIITGESLCHHSSLL